MRPPRYLAAFTCAAALCGCSGDDPAAPPDSSAPLPTETTCRLPGGICGVYAHTADVLAGDKAGCELAGGLWGAACPTTYYVGRCASQTPYGASTLVFSPPLWDATAAKNVCAQTGGAWTDGDTLGGPGTGPVQTVSCSSVADHVCEDATGAMSAEARAALEEVCVAFGDVVLGGACPTEGRTGTCTVVIAGITHRERFYDAATAVTDAADCSEAGGTWTAG